MSAIDDIIALEIPPEVLLATPLLDVVELPSGSVIIDIPNVEIVPEVKGLKGDKGDKGDIGGSLTTEFSFGDATPTQIADIAAGDFLSQIVVYIYQSFNEPCAISIYDETNTYLIITTHGEILSIDVSPAIKYTAQNRLFLELTPSIGQTTGKGVIHTFIGQQHG